MIEVWFDINGWRKRGKIALWQHKSGVVKMLLEPPFNHLVGDREKPVEIEMVEVVLRDMGKSCGGMPVYEYD